MRSNENIKHIFLATDLTPACDRAFDRAVQLASQWNARLTLFHVVEAGFLHLRSIAPRLKRAEIEIERLVRDSRVDLKYEITSHVVVGDPAERTLRKARDNRCDLIVTGPGRGTGLKARLFGATLVRVARKADHPVLSVRRRVHGPYDKIAVGVDFSPPARGALETALALFPKSYLRRAWLRGIT